MDGWMVVLHVALELIWQLLKCPESWRWSRKLIQIISGGGREGMESGFMRRGKPSKTRTKTIFCFVSFGQHSRNMFMAVGLIVI